MLNTKTNDNKYFSYIRKSTDDRENQKLTLNAQLFEIKRFAKLNGLTIAGHFEERRSAKRAGRPVFRDMLNRIKKGEASGILAFHPDRLSRNSLDAGEIIYLLDDGGIADLKFPQFSFENTPHGKFLLYQAFALSKLEVDTLSQRVKTAYEEKARQGHYPTKAPPGYRNDKRTKTVAVDKRRALFVVRAFKMCATGNYSVPQIRSELTRAGFRTRRGKPLSLSKYHFILNHTFYYGIFRFAGEWYKGQHHPLISKSLFHAAERQLKRQERKWSRNFKPFLYRGRLKCAECGASITFEVQKGKGYLHCTKKRGACGQRYLRKEQMNQQLGNAIREISLPKSTLSQLAVTLQKKKSDFLSEIQKERAALNRSVGELKIRHERTIELMLNDILSEAEFVSTKRAIIEEQAAVDDKIARIDCQAANPLEPVETVLKQLNEATILENSKNEEKKFEFLKNVGSNLKISNRALQVTWEKPFSLAAEWKKRFRQSGGKHVRKDTNWLLVNLLGYCSTGLAA
jgi:site-specific DNA recombinase